MKKLFQRACAALLACIMVLTGFPVGGIAAVNAAEKTGIYQGQPARFSYGAALKTADGQTYQFTGKDLNWMQVYCYNYQTGQPYIGGARELPGPLERYRIRTADGSFVGYCIEHGVMIDESLQLTASDYKNAVITAGLGEDVMQNIKLSLFYGRQNGDTIGNLLEPQESGGLGFRDSEFYGDSALDYTLDDWEMATVMLIRESQQKFRDSRFRLKSGGNGLSYTNGWRGAETGRINADHYVKPLKGKASYDIYRYMEQLCQDHLLFSSAVASMNYAAPKNIAFGAEDRDQEGNYFKKIAVSAGRAYPLKAVKADDPSAEAAGITFNLVEENGKFFYEVTVDRDVFREGEVFALAKTLQCRVPTDDLMVWECETTNGHLQAITTGMADPVQGYFSLSTKAEPVEGEPPEPEYFPAFEFPVSKEDLNPGWDGSVNTPMGDATLGATYVLYRDGVEVDRITLDAWGNTEVLTDQPWMREADLERTESGETELHVVETGNPPEPADHGCGTVTPTEVEWSANCTYTIREIAPDGRFTEPDAYGEERQYAVSYSAATKDQRQYACEEPAWQDIGYKVDYRTMAGGGSEGSTGEGTADTLDEILSFDEEVFVNDCYRGKLTLSKSLEIEDVFKDSPMGGHPDSVNSRWKLYLADGGYEGNPHVRFIGEENLADGTAVYRVTRDQSGSNNITEDLLVGSNGDMVICDIPYGTYWMEEVAADDASFVREKFLVEIGEHSGPYTTEDDYDNRYDYNIRDKKITNRVKILKTDAETGKGVDLAGTKFYIRYKGSPLNTDTQNQKLENYNRYLPDAAEITSDGPYTFEADENGELTIQYQLPYGIYEITEWQVPEGYYIEGEGNVYTFTVDEQPVHVDGNFGQMVTFDGQISDADASYDPAQYPYTAYYKAVAMKNNQVKGRISVEKKGEILTGFLEETLLGHKIFRPVYEMAGKLKNAVFGIFAAEDIMLSDGNDGPKIYDVQTGEEIVIPESESTHADASEVYEAGSMTHSSGAKLSYFRERESGHGGKEGEDNHYTRVYVSPEQKDTTYSCSYEISGEIYNYCWDISVAMNYQAGGRNVTDMVITKTTSVQNGYADAIPLTYPEGIVEESGVPVNISPLASHICGNVSPDEECSSNFLSVFGKTETYEEDTGQLKGAVQTYEVSFVQEGGNSDGFSLSWDDFRIESRADHTMQTAVTRITGNADNAAIDCGIGYTYTTDGGVVTFTAAEPAAPVYFLSEDGIRTEMYYFGGYMKAILEIPQSAMDKDFGTVVPDLGFDWYSKLTPSEPVAVFEPVRGTKVTSTRHESSETGMAESYTLEIVSSQTREEPFEISFADGYKMSFFTETTDSGKDTGVLVLDGVYKTTRYTMSELVETIRTGEDGRAESSLLPLGKYIVRELEAPVGYVLDDEEKEAELKYVDQFTPVVRDKVSTENDCVQIEIDIKKAFETSYQSGIFEAGKGAIFGLYTAEEDKLIDMFQTGESGRILGKVKIPLNQVYYIKELYTPGSYSLNTQKYYFKAADNREQPDITKVAATGYMASFEHVCTETETITFTGAGSFAPVIEAEVTHSAEGHSAIIASGTDRSEIKPGEKTVIETGKETWASAELDADGKILLTHYGICPGIIEASQVPSVSLNGQPAETTEYCRSVTMARQGSREEVIQVKINTNDDISSGAVLNYRKEVTEPDTVPQLPPRPDKPEIPEPELPEPVVTPEIPETEEPESTPQKVTVIPETGESAALDLWALTAAISMAVLIVLLSKKEKEN